jgi:hypothetical protein
MTDDDVKVGHLMAQSYYCWKYIKLYNVGLKRH